MTNSIMAQVGCPSHWWLLGMLYIVNLLNHLSNSKGYIPCTILTGEVTNISTDLDYNFWQEVFVQDPNHGKCLAIGVVLWTNKVISSPTTSSSMTLRNWFNTATYALPKIPFSKYQQMQTSCYWQCLHPTFTTSCLECV